MRKLADEVAEDPTTEATLKARADRLGTILDWARDGLPGLGEGSRTLLFSARGPSISARTPEACRQIDGAVLGAPGSGRRKLLLATPTGQESAHPRPLSDRRGTPGTARQGEGHRPGDLRLARRRPSTAGLKGARADDPRRGCQGGGPRSAARQRRHPGHVAFAALISEEPRHVDLARKWRLAQSAIDAGNGKRR